MRRLSHLRHIAKWVGVSSCVLLCAMWAWTLRYEGYLDLTERVNVLLREGYLEFRIHEDPWDLTFCHALDWRPLWCMFTAPEMRTDHRGFSTFISLFGSYS